jgi:DNA-binding transcriptional ArsR family regulator
MKTNSYYLFNILANKTRWKIINTLLEKDSCVNEICNNCCEEQSKISHNLKKLYDCNIVFYKKEGRKKIYYLNKKTINDLINIIDEHKKNYCLNNCKNRNCEKYE